MKHLYVLFLENEKWILHPSTTSDPYYIFMECYFMYDFVKANCPLRIFETIPIADDLEIDMYVKKYMRCYGIENVRGGNYSDVFLPSTIITMLESEIQKDYYEMPLFIEQICRKYESIQNWTSHDIKVWRTWRREYEFIDEPASIKHAMELEKSYLKKEWTQYEDTKYLYDALGQNFYDCSIDLEWLKMQIIDTNDMEEVWVNKKDRMNRYAMLLSLFETAKARFELISEDLPRCSCDVAREKYSVFYKNPRLIFDTFIYHKQNALSKQTISEKYKTIAIEVFEIFEYMINCIINKIEDYRFSLKQYPEDFERRIRYSLEYIDYTYFTDIM